MKFPAPKCSTVDPGFPTAPDPATLRNWSWPTRAVTTGRDLPRPRLWSALFMKKMGGSKISFQAILLKYFWCILELFWHLFRFRYGRYPQILFKFTLRRPANAGLCKYQGIKPNTAFGVCLNLTAWGADVTRYDSRKQISRDLHMPVDANLSIHPSIYDLDITNLPSAK